jgi:hypothetical protein
MGSRRMSLARIEALIENMKRELSLGGSTLSGLKREVIRQTTATGWNDSAYSLTISQSGALILFDKDEATTVTLPAITSSDLGTTFAFLETIASNTARKVQSAYDNDYLIGGVALNFDGASTDSTGTYAFIKAGATERAITFDDNIANGAGGVGSVITVTAVLAGNTGAGGGSKFVWAIEGTMVAVAENSGGAQIFS